MAKSTKFVANDSTDDDDDDDDADDEYDGSSGGSMPLGSSKNLASMGSVKRLDSEKGPPGVKKGRKVSSVLVVTENQLARKKTVLDDDAGEEEDHLTVRVELSGSTEIEGRVKECGILSSHIQQLAKGAKGVVLIEGEVGVGKSALVQYVYSQAELGQIRCASAVGQVMEMQTMYFVIRKLILDLLKVCSECRPLRDLT